MPVEERVVDGNYLLRNGADPRIVKPGLGEVRHLDRAVHRGKGDQEGEAELGIDERLGCAAFGERGTHHPVVVAHCEAEFRNVFNGQVVFAH